MYSTVSGHCVWLSLAQAPTVTSLRLVLARLTGITPQENILLLTSEGRMLHHDDSMENMEIILSQITPGPGQPHFYLYSLSPSNLNKVINIPDLVKLALTDTRRSLQDYHQKKMFAQGYHFINEHYQSMTMMVTSLKILDTYLRARLESITEVTRSLTPDKRKMEVKYEMFKDCYQVGKYFDTK